MNNTIDQIDLADIYRAFHSAEAKHTFFSSTTSIDCMSSYKTSIKFKKTEVMPPIFSDHNGKKTRNQQQKHNGKFHKYVEIKQQNIEQPTVREKIKIEIEKYTETNKAKTTCKAFSFSFSYGFL